MYTPVVSHFLKTESPSLSVPSEIEIDETEADRQQAIDLVPHVLATGLGIGTSRSKYVFKCLLDSGGTGPMINRKCIPSNVTLDACNTVRFATTQGEFASVFKVQLCDLCLPEFLLTRRFGIIEPFVFDAPQCPYNILLGRKFMQRAKMTLDFAKCRTHWLGASVPFHPKGYFSDKTKLHQLLAPLCLLQNCRILFGFSCSCPGRRV
jgi:hypothetical protein